MLVEAEEKRIMRIVELARGNTSRTDADIARTVEEEFGRCTKPFVKKIRKQYGVERIKRG